MGHCCFDFSNIASDTSPDDDSPTTVGMYSEHISSRQSELSRGVQNVSRRWKRCKIRVAESCKNNNFFSCQIHCLKKNKKIWKCIDDSATTPTIPIKKYKKILLHLLWNPQNYNFSKFVLPCCRLCYLKWKIITVYLPNRSKPYRILKATKNNLQNVNFFFFVPLP